MIHSITRDSTIEFLNPQIHPPELSVIRVESRSIITKQPLWDGLKINHSFFS